MVIVGMVVSGRESLHGEVEAADDQHPGPHEPEVPQRCAAQQHGGGDGQGHRVGPCQRQALQPLEELAVAEHRVQNGAVPPGQVAHRHVLVRVRQEGDERLEESHLQVLERVGEHVVRHGMAHHPLPGGHEAQLEVVPPPVLPLVEEVVRAGAGEGQQQPGDAAHQVAAEADGQEARQQRGHGQRVHDVLGALLGIAQHLLRDVLVRLAHALPQLHVEAVPVEGERRVARSSGRPHQELGQQGLGRLGDVVREEEFGNVDALGELQPLPAARVALHEGRQVVQVVLHAPEALGAVHSPPVGEPAVHGGEEALVPVLGVGPAEAVPARPRGRRGQAVVMLVDVVRVVLLAAVTLAAQRHGALHVGRHPASRTGSPR